MEKVAHNAANDMDTTLNNGYKSLSHQADAIISLMERIWGEDYLKSVVKREEVEREIQSDLVEDKIYALQRIVLKDDSYVDDPIYIMEKIQCEIAGLIAKQHVENKIEEEVEKFLEEKQDKLIDEIKLRIIKKKDGPENSRTLKKLTDLQKMEGISLSKSIMEKLRPSSINEIVGQDRAVSSIISKLASPYPQHIILYGPPGVGKTTAARLALAIAKEIKSTPFMDKASFIEVDGTTLRWDPREVTNPLLGSVHDPIYQGSSRDFAETGIPEPKIGLVTEAHGGVLFIDEIGEIDFMLQNKLLKVLEDKKVEFSSSYYDPDDENVPQYIRKLFKEGAPADFVLIGATTRDPQEINPALRSRCTEVFFEPLNKKDIQKIVINAAEKLKITMDDNVPEVISNYTTEGRRAVNIISDAYGYVIYKRGEESINITESDIYEVASLSRLTPNNKKMAKDTAETGQVFGLGVYGFLGSIIEIEAIAFKSSEGSGKIRFNDTAGSMAKDSVFTAASVIRKITGEDTSDYDIHVNVIGGGNVDGPSAGVAITIAMMSAVTGRAIRQDVAITGEISLLGNVKPVGGVIEKIYGAVQAGMKKIIIPEENKKDIPQGIDDIEIIPVKNINEVMDIVF